MKYTAFLHAGACILATFVSFTLCAQSTGDFPYNPDANGNQTIEVTDLVEFLTVFGANYLPIGVLPVEGGGTGVTTVDSAKIVLQVSTYSDITAAGQVNPRGQINGALNITQSLNQGFGTEYSGPDR